MLRLVRDAHDNGGSQSPIGEMLMGAHDRWLATVRQIVTRILAPDVAVMERWTALAELDRELGEWYDGELKLARDLAPLLANGADRRLARAQHAIARVREEISALVPSPDSAAALREAVLDLLDVLQLWCAELELAVTDVAVGQLSGESKALLRRLGEVQQ